MVTVGKRDKDIACFEEIFLTVGICQDFTVEHTDELDMVMRMIPNVEQTCSVAVIVVEKILVSDFVRKIHDRRQLLSF